MIKRILTISLTLVLLRLSAGQAYLSHGNLGLGVQAGEPSGLSAKLWTGSSTALDASAGWNFFTERFSCHAGYLIHFPLNVYAADVAVYSGMGLVLGISKSDVPDSSVYLAGRIPVGIEAIFGRVALYAEVDPRINFIPDNDFGLGGGAGLRFYF